LTNPPPKNLKSSKNAIFVKNRPAFFAPLKRKIQFTPTNFIFLWSSEHGQSGNAPWFLNFRLWKKSIFSWRDPSYKKVTVSQNECYIRTRIGTRIPTISNLWVRNWFFGSYPEKTATIYHFRGHFSCCMDI
jgi:hypothetical protein